MHWLGDYKEDDTIYFLWSSNDANGASVTRTVDGEVRVYKDNNVAQSVLGITDTEDFDGLTGVHACTIDLSSDAFYATGADYSVVLQGATIDAQTVNALLAHFSIENRYKGEVGADSKFLISTDAQDLSGTLDVNTKTITAGICGDATASTQTTIINHLTDVKGTSFVKDTHSLTNILSAAKKVFIRAGRP